MARSHRGTGSTERRTEMSDQTRGLTELERQELAKRDPAPWPTATKPERHELERDADLEAVAAYARQISREAIVTAQRLADLADRLERLRARQP